MSKNKDLTLRQIVKNQLSKMEVGDNFNVKEFINKHWTNGYDYFTNRSFDVYLYYAKKEFPKKVFKTNKGNVTRIS